MNLVKTMTMPTSRTNSRITRSEVEWLVYKYKQYAARGFLILSATLTTGVRSEWIANSSFFSPIWTKGAHEAPYQ